MNKYEIVGIVGEGAYGIVYKAKNKETGEFGKYHIVLNTDISPILHISIIKTYPSFWHYCNKCLNFLRL